MANRIDPRNQKFEKYGLFWPATMNAAAIETYMIRHGGQWKRQKDGGTVGLGLFDHYKNLQDLLWPEQAKYWHKWRILTLKSFVENRFIGIMGSASSAKSHDAALYGLCKYYAWFDCCTVIVTSTTISALQLRIWSEITKHHKTAKRRCEWLPGYLVESKQRLVTEDRQEGEGRDWRNGIVGIPCRVGNQWVGISSLIGIKNKHILLIGDELSLMEEGYLNSISNLNKNPGFQCIGMGNPKEATDPLGKLCEPASELGGWDGGIDQVGGTKTWKTRFNEGICLQLVGTDSPNMDSPAGAPIPFPFLIKREDIENDIKFYGTDSWQYKMQNEARLPRGQGSRRVITRQLCLKFVALEQPIWKDSERTKIASLDSAYRGVGGDRCVLSFGEFGKALDVNGMSIEVFALTEPSIIVPIKSQIGNAEELPEDEIAVFVKTQCEIRGVPPDHFGFDSTGRGSLMAAFARIWSAYVQPVEFGGKGTERPVSSEIQTTCREYFDRFLSELWWMTRLCIESGQTRGMTEEVMMEGCQREWKVTAGNKVSVETKEEMKKKMGRSPDLYDSYVVLLEMARRLGFHVSRLTKPGQFMDQEKWKRDLKEKAAKLQGAGQLTYR